MGDSTKALAVKKPRLDFPLFPHATGRWAKKVRGKLHYFGKTADDPNGERALDDWLAKKDDLLAGRTPRVAGEGLTVKELCNRFLTAKQRRLDSGELSIHSWRDYDKTCRRLADELGKTRLVSDLRSDDFEKLRATLAENRGHTSLGNEIQRVRVVFKYGYDAGLIDQPMRFGPQFKRPSRKTMRLARAKAGPKMFEAADVKALLAKSTLQLKAMILLAMNCGFGNQDCATLTLGAVDLERGWITFPRPKTGIERRCPLWPETIDAMRRVLAKRKAPDLSEHAELVFVTKRGGSFAKETSDNPVAKEFAKIVAAAGLKRDGRGFYALRHTFRTIADGCRDFPAIDLIMGHTADTMADRYRERIDDERLQAVVAHVRAWLFPRAGKGKRTEKAADKPKAARKPRKAAEKAETGCPVLRVVG